METVGRESVELVHAYAEALEERDLERLQALVHPDFELKPLRTGVTLRLADLREQWSRDGDSGYDHLDVETRRREPQDADGHVVLEAEQILRWKDSGDVASTLERAFVFTVEDGRIRRVEAFLSPQDAWASVGGRA